MRSEGRGGRTMLQVAETTTKGEELLRRSRRDLLTCGGKRKESTQVRGDNSTLLLWSKLMM